MPKTNLGKGTCVGKAVSEMEVRVIEISEDPISTMSDAALLPAGEIGELVVRGPVVTKAYDQLEEATAKAKIADGQSIWHRMGDTGYLDEDGNVWFCGRVAERVQTESGVLFTDPVEAHFNQQPNVFRSALIGLGELPNQTPAIVIQPEKDHWTDDYIDHQAWEKELLASVPPDSIAAKVEKVFFYKDFPVDVRHNAKIHRLTLAEQYSRKS